MANTAQTQIALANGSQFRARFLGLLVQAALQTLTTPVGQGNPPVTGGQQTYARLVLANPQQYAATLILTFVFRTNLFQSTVTVDIVEGVPIVRTDASDLAILGQIVTDWPLISGA